MNTLRRFVAHPKLRWILRPRPVRWLSARVAPLRFLITLRLLVDWRLFLWHYMSRARDTRMYHLRRSNFTVLLQPRTADLEVLDEVFKQRIYDPPSAARSAILASTHPTILDLGANIGIASLRFMNLFPEALLTAYEPDAENLMVLKKCFAANGLDDRATVVEACAFNKTGSVAFQQGCGAGSAVVLETGSRTDGEELQAYDILPHLAEADLVKMDIEGSEWPILTDPRFPTHRPRALVMEYHRYGCPSRNRDRLAPDPNPRQLATTLLGRAGFTVLSVSHNAWGHGVLWAWRTDSDDLRSSAGGTTAR